MSEGAICHQVFPVVIVLISSYENLPQAFYSSLPYLTIIQEQFGPPFVEVSFLIVRKFTDLSQGDHGVGQKGQPGAAGIPGAVGERGAPGVSEVRLSCSLHTFMHNVSPIRLAVRGRVCLFRTPSIQVLASGLV